LRSTEICDAGEGGVLGRTIAQAITAEVSATAAKTAQRRKMIDAKLRSPPTGSL
jgi:hypothetical protein